jgi:hypothetical protein
MKRRDQKRKQRERTRSERNQRRLRRQNDLHVIVNGVKYLASEVRVKIDGVTLEWKGSHERRKHDCEQPADAGPDQAVER